MSTFGNVFLYSSVGKIYAPILYILHIGYQSVTPCSIQRSNAYSKNFCCFGTGN